MNLIDDYFRQYSDKISFIELKPDSKNESLRRDIPYPIYTDELVEGVKTGEFEDGLGYDVFVKGMISLIAIDPEFIHVEYYLSLLNGIKKLKNYVLSEGIKSLQSNSESAVFYFRFLHLENLSTPFSEYNYARLLYGLYESDDKDFLRIECINILEKLIETNPDFPLSYYELGIINAKEKYYSKSYNFFNKALEKTEDELVKGEIREFLLEVTPNAYIEFGIDAMNRGDFSKSFEYFIDSKQLEDSALANYYLGLISENSNNLEVAINYYIEAIEKGAEFKEVFQNLSILYYRLGDYGTAVDVLSSGLKHNYEDHTLLYNRAVIYLELGDLQNGKKDIDTLLMYGDLDEMIIENIRQLKSVYDI